MKESQGHITSCECSGRCTYGRREGEETAGTRRESPVSLHPQESRHPVYGARVQSKVNQGKSQGEEAIVLTAGGDNEGRDDPA